MRFNRELELAVNLVSTLNDQPKTLATIAPIIGGTIPFLEQISAKLRRAGLITSKKGPHGGYTKTSNVTLWQIMTAIGQERQAVSGEFAFLCDRVESIMRQTNV